MKKILEMTIGLVMLATCAFAQMAPETTYVWEAPTYGTPVVEYVVELNINGGGWIELARTPNVTYTFTTFEYLNTYEVRVAGVDALDRQGPFSISSDPYTPDLGAPGAPSKPIIKTI